MSVAYIVLAIVPSQEHDVYRAIVHTPCVVEVHPLFGEYDLLVKLDVDSLEKLTTTVDNTIRAIPGILDIKLLTGGLPKAPTKSQTD